MAGGRVNCPVCDAVVGAPFLVRESVPVHQNLVVATREAARHVTRGRLELRCCDACGFVFNSAFDASLLAYGEDYDNTQSHSASFKAYLDVLVTRLVEERGVRDARVVEVGCGKGYFLEAVVAAHPGNRGYGFDPSYLGPDSKLDGRLQFRRELYGPGCEQTSADIVICRHVIEHVADPRALLSTVRAALAGSPRARVAFETPTVEWILEHVVHWDFFYEHCSLFTPASLTTAFERSGFRVESVETLFGGQYQWLEATLAEPTSAPRLDPGRTPALAHSFTTAEQQWHDGWLARLSAPSKQTGKTAIWGAGAKGVTFANLVDPDGTLVDCVVDLNPHKQGRFLPGTGHPILAPADLGARGVTRAILMNPNYRAETVELLETLQLTVSLED